MPGVPNPMIKEVIRGTIDTVQGWSCGLYFAIDDGSPDEADFVAAGTAMMNIADSWASFMGSRVWDTATKYTGCTYYFYPAGSTKATFVSDQTSLFPVTGSASNHAPRQLALVCSTRSQFSGRSRRGRFYIPRTGGNFDATGQEVSTDVTNVANASRDLIAHTNALTSGMGSITSLRGVVASFTTGVTSTIERVIVDSLVDTQRRREDQLAATFQQEVLV